MTKLVLTLLAAATVAAPAFADSPVKPIAFQRGGISYVATVTDQADGARLIEGYEKNTGRTFTLHVSGKQVTGVYDGADVAYDAPTPRRAATER